MANRLACDRDGVKTRRFSSYFFFRLWRTTSNNLGPGIRHDLVVPRNKGDGWICIQVGDAVLCCVVFETEGWTWYEDVYCGANLWLGFGWDC